MYLRYIADLHWYDVNSLLWRQDLGLDLQSYVEFSVDNWNQCTDDSDITIVAGDVGKECSQCINAYKRLKGTKVLVLGNHDSEWSVENLEQCFDSIVPMVRNGNIIITHIPPEKPITSLYVVHGHHHTYDTLEMSKARINYLQDRMRFNCCADLNGSKPCTFLELQVNKEHIRTKLINERNN